MVDFYGKCREIYQSHGSYGICKNSTNPNALHVHEKSPNTRGFCSVLLSSSPSITIHHRSQDHQQKTKHGKNMKKLQTSRALWKTNLGSHRIWLNFEKTLVASAWRRTPLTPSWPIQSHLHFLVGIDTYRAWQSELGDGKSKELAAGCINPSPWSHVISSSSKIHPK